MNFHVVIGNIEITAKQETFSFSEILQKTAAWLCFFKDEFILFVSHILQLFPDTVEIKQRYNNFFFLILQNYFWYKHTIN